MAGHLVGVRPPPIAYRFAYGREPWAFPDWSRAHADGTFGNRHDDPLGVYRVLYAASQRVGTFIETMARFRPDLHVLAGLAEIKCDDGDEEQTIAQPGELVVDEWLSRRRLGYAELGGVYCDVGHEESLAFIREQLAPTLLRLGYADFDASTLRSADRRVTQQISRVVYEAENGGESFAGIRYQSRLGDDIDNWAIFEDSPLSPMRDDRVRRDDEDLVVAARTLGVVLT